MFLLVLAAAVGGAAGSSTDARVMQAVEYCYRQMYDSAGAVVRELATDRSDPVGSYWHGALLQSVIYDSGNRGLVDSFYATCNRTVELCRARLKRNPDDAAAHFYVGMSQLGRAQMQSWLQQTASAAKTMLGVSGELKAALARDSSLYGAWFGIGMVDYALAMTQRYTLGIGLVGSKKRGYELVSRAAGRPGPFQTQAQFGLAYMMKENGNFRGVESTCRALLQRYPGSRALNRMLRDAYLKYKDYSRCIRLGPVVDSLILASFPSNRYGRAENWLVTGKAWFELGQRDSARACFDRVLALEPYRDKVPWLPTYLRQARDYRNKLGT